MRNAAVNDLTGELANMLKLAGENGQGLEKMAAGLGSAFSGLRAVGGFVGQARQMMGLVDDQPPHDPRMHKSGA